MANNAKKAILRALIEGQLTDLFVKTNVENVMYDDSTTLSAKLASILTDIDARAKSADVTKEIKQAINDLIGGAPDTYDTLKEIADYIETHEGVKDALQAAIGDKLDKTTFETFCNSISKLGALAGKDKVSDGDLEETLKKKIDDAAQGNHSHTNKEALDGITAEKVTGWDDAAAKKHEHTNKETLDKVTEEKLTAWDAKSTTYVAKEQPAGIKAGDLWFQIVDDE